MVAPLRLGIIGLGNIGQQHLELVSSGAVTRATVTATCSRTPGGRASASRPAPGGRASASRPTKGMQPPASRPAPGGRASASRPTKGGRASASRDQPTHYTNHHDLINSGDVDAVLIATPTMSHYEIAAAALAAGLHVLVEKPITRSLLAAEKLVALAKPGQLFAVMLNQRMHPDFVRIRSLLQDGTLGKLQRVSWTMTHWYRPDVYFKVSPWRGTWVGEGGGVLLNQCIHNLDILQWLVGMPSAVRAWCGFGRYHDIEVEDEVTAYLEFGGASAPVEAQSSRDAAQSSRDPVSPSTSRATVSQAPAFSGTVVASTGEAPGINQLDIVGDRGTIRYDGNVVTLTTNAEGTRAFTATTLEMFGTPEPTRTTVQSGEPVNQHAVLLQNFVDAILGGSPPDGDVLLTPAAAGLPSLELANAMLMSTWTDETVALPLDAARYETLLEERLASSELRTPADLDVTIDMNKSYR